jgi:hypothetical protein
MVTNPPLVVAPIAADGRLSGVQLPEFRSSFARAVTPVIGGTLVFAAIGGFTWAIASYISGGDTGTTERIAPSFFTIGQVESLSATVERDGPLLFPELGTAIGTRSIVVDHDGDLPADGWRVYWAYPADRDATCVVDQVVGTSDFVDCDGRTIDVAELSPPDSGVVPRVQDRTTLIVDLRGATTVTTVGS